MIEHIRKYIGREEFDYQTLSEFLKNYSHPRDKITDLLRKKIIIRVKKGLYVFGEDYRRRPYSLELLANLIFGPSYISLDYALQHYGMIPERVETVTSVTTGRSKKFVTPVGVFTYQTIPLSAFQTGMDMVELESGNSFLIATPEKALADKIRCDQALPITSQQAVCSYLFDSLRLDPTILQEMDPDKIEQYAEDYGSRKIRLLADLMRRRRPKKI
ncbi:MAG: hypothetical protein H8E41_07670 [Desulfobulbaceae bacterium]|uniref:Transcriptional regulator, AbiEi antitoxin, Type IV TA system n=1 Tax=Candidatus Desulfobia pelagia TaxID=2841692 RepID=A0A8J6NE26_9BACT|nr:hypothetical protein [Candidatus Desulfobia pelagia]